MENGNFGSQLRDNFSQYIGFSLSVPIFNRFETRNRVRSARIQQHTYYWQLEESKKNLYKEIQQAYYNAVNAETQYHSSLTADEAAQASFLLMKEKYTNGKANATEYNESRTAWMKAVSDRLQANTTTCSAPRYSISTGVFHLRCNTTRNDIRLYKKRAAGDTPRTTCGIFVVYISETRYRAYYFDDTKIGMSCYIPISCV